MISIETSTYAKKAGQLIKSLRMGGNLTQRRLAKIGEVDEICSVRHLRRIENGEVEISHHLLVKLLAVLGVAMQEFDERLDGKETIAFNNKFSAIIDLLFDRKYTEADNALKKLKDMDFYDKKNPRIAQALLLCEGILLKNLHKDLNRSLDIFFDALDKTAPNLKSVELYSLNLKNISTSALSWNEYRLLNNIASTKGDLGQIDEKIKILRASIMSVKINADTETKKRLLPTAYYNLTNALIDSESYCDAIKICDEGIEICNKAKTTKNLGELYHNKAKAFFFLGYTEAAKEGFEKARYIFELSGNHKNVERIIEIVQEKYGIQLAN